jgi:hypothetical protein
MCNRIRGLKVSGALARSLITMRRLPQSSGAPQNPAKVDKRTRSKWSSRVLRYAMAYKPVVARLFSARAASTNVRRDLPAASGRGGQIACVERFRFRLTAELFHGVGKLIATQ